MKTQFRAFLFLLSVCLFAISAALFAGDLSPDQKQFLSGYEHIRAALATDDLEGARKAASALGQAGSEVTQSQSLRDARKAFENLSAQAIKISANQPGFYVVHCDMANKDWVQISKEISNPYLGKEMQACGEIRK